MKKHRKIQKKQETELHVQVAEKPENQKGFKAKASYIWDYYKVRINLVIAVNADTVLLAVNAKPLCEIAVKNFCSVS